MDEPCVSHSSPQRSGGQAGTEVQRQGRPSVIRCGWLRKQGGFVKTWHSRWFVLRGDQLHYYKDEEETKALGAIFLPGNKVTEHPTSGDEGGKFLFEIISGGDRERMTANHETYLLMASTQNDMEDWVKTIRRVIWAPFGGGIFGQKLEETVRYERRFGNKLAPMLVEQCVDFIRQWGLREEGLFRLPGQANLVKELQDAFDCGEKPSFDCNTDVHTVASLLKLYLRELPEPVVPFNKFDDFLASSKLLSKDDEMGMKELRKLVEDLPRVNYNLLKYICRFLDEVQSYSGVNKMSVQNLATVFGPNILRPKVEDPVAIMEDTVLVQQLMAVLIGRQDVLFPLEEDSPTALELANNNNMELPRGQATTTTSAITTVTQNTENNNTQVVRQCVWEAPESPSHRQHVDNNVSPRSASPRSGVIGRFDITRSPPMTVKKNPAFSKGSGIVTNGSFSSSPSADPSQEKSQTLTGGGSLPVRRSGTLKGSGTKMGTSGVTSGGSAGGNGTGVVRMGLSGTDVGLNGRNGLWVPNGCVTLRDNNKTRDSTQVDQTSNQNRLSTYDNVQLNHHNLQQQNHIANTCLNSSCEDKQSVDSATWSTSSCEISLPDNSTSCRSSTTTCPEQDFYGGHYEDIDGAVRDTEPKSGGGGEGEGEGRNSNREGSGEGAGGSSRGTSSSDNSEGYTVGNGAGSHSALHSLVASLKQEMNKQKTEYEARIKSLEQRNVELETEMVSLHEELDQERKKYTMAEIKLRNAERAKDDAERRNTMLQKEMEQFFSTFSDLTATGNPPAADPRRPDRNNPIWIQ
ncbi:rho GTPase-activating protein 24 isoform X1 [Pseudochaenichthys georgianus]|uniref:rho GTPase-activating protein 24 isoform X1 n=2 Tax=Pseudochaenichthys georgianus TaxID=52239 RepID=UPI001469D67F|nr:rho GTPase-activating protein 24 isoform X1 [Pseudochaenichthys georgianus]XP_033951745.1 rho GTPase-activating protein 24 isoform X1 [Pseudochaenichthys georgianus]